MAQRKIWSRPLGGRTIYICETFEIGRVVSNTGRRDDRITQACPRHVRVSLSWIKLPVPLDAELEEAA